MSTSENQLMAQAAWLYYMGGLTQEETSTRLGLTRARVNRLLQQARESGIVSISISSKDIGLLPLEDKIRREFGLQFCTCTPTFEISAEDRLSNPTLNELPRKAVGAAAAQYLTDFLTSKPNAVVGTGWGRSLEQVTRSMAGQKFPQARFISLMGSLTANSAFNPLEVVQALARITGGEGYFLPVPFIADTAEDKDVLWSQRAVSKPLELARNTDLALISVGELTDKSLLRSQGMISADDLKSLRAAGAVGDTNGIFFDIKGRPVDHPLMERTLALDFKALQRSTTVVLAAGSEKVEAAYAVLRSGVPKGLIIDGDSAHLLEQRIDKG